MTTPTRLLRLLSLLQTAREWPGGELARRLGVSRRTVRRDVERLRELGYPVVASRGAEGGYRLVAGAALPPLSLDDEEAVAVAVGLRNATAHAVTGLGEAALRALTKVEQVLPSRLRYRVTAVHSAVEPGPELGESMVDPTVLTVVAAAIGNTERLRFAYRSRGGERSRRHVEPHRLVPLGRCWYLVAFDLDRDDWRTFRADRIAEPFATGARAAPRRLPADDAASVVADALSRLGPTHEAVVTVFAPATEIDAGLGDVEPLDERRCLVRCHADTAEWLAVRLLSLGHEFRVHEPPELLDQVREVGRRALRAASPDEASSAP
ncbi:YafY family protein [Saccharomonospora sp. NB11]|jgi:biotin operon repressor BirA-like protein|uniref:helix-turn-helix transcriptional regulator n=1 Tax=Saccharomonospora sp. NB11 TaxID=1642298 RepID=UPI0018D1DDDF|nr:YafY family protein [Saccharomonospora sp. NB11]